MLDGMKLAFPFGNELVNVEFKDALQETLLAELNAIKKKSESEN